MIDSNTNDNKTEFETISFQCFYQMFQTRMECFFGIDEVLGIVFAEHP